MLFLLFTLITSILAFPAAVFQVSLPSFLRSSDGRVAYYSKQAEKYANLVNDAVDKEAKMFNAGKYLEAAGKQLLHSLKNPKARADMQAKGYLDAPTTASKDFNFRKYLENLLSKIRSNDENVEYYSKEAYKFAKQAASAPTKELKRYYQGKYLEASGKQILHSLKSYKSKVDLKAARLTIINPNKS